LQLAVKSLSLASWNRHPTFHVFKASRRVEGTLRRNLNKNRGRNCLTLGLAAK